MSCDSLRQPRHCRPADRLAWFLIERRRPFNNIVRRPPSCVTVRRRSSGTRRGTGVRAIAAGFDGRDENENRFRLGDLATGVGRQQTGQSALVGNHVREQQGECTITIIAP